MIMLKVFGPESPLINLGPWTLRAVRLGVTYRGMFGGM